MLSVCAHTAVRCCPVQRDTAALKALQLSLAWSLHKPKKVAARADQEEQEEAGGADEEEDDVWEVEELLELLHGVFAELKQRVSELRPVDRTPTVCVELPHVPATREGHREVPEDFIRQQNEGGRAGEDSCGAGRRASAQWPPLRRSSTWSSPDIYQLYMHSYILPPARCTTQTVVPPQRRAPAPP